MNFINKKRVVLSDERNHHYNWKELLLIEIPILYQTKVTSGENTNNPVFAHLNSVIYKFFDQEQDLLSMLFYERSVVFLARELVKHFFIIHGTKSVIIRYEYFIFVTLNRSLSYLSSKMMTVSECNTISLEAKSYNLGVERVSPILHAIMTHAEDFPSMEKLYKEFNNYFLSLPEFVASETEKVLSRVINLQQIALLIFLVTLHFY